MYDFITKPDNHISPRYNMKALMIIVQAYIRGTDIQQDYQHARQFARSVFNYFKLRSETYKKDKSILDYAKQAGETIITLQCRKIFDKKTN